MNPSFQIKEARGDLCMEKKVSERFGRIWIGPECVRKYLTMFKISPTQKDAFLINNGGKWGRGSGAEGGGYENWVRQGKGPNSK